MILSAWDVPFILTLLNRDYDRGGPSSLLRTASIRGNIPTFCTLKQKGPPGESGPSLRGSCGGFACSSPPLAIALSFGEAQIKRGYYNPY